MKTLNNNEQLLASLWDRLTDIQSDDLSPLDRLGSALTICRTNLQKLKDDVLAKPFLSEQEEINFFKKVKPYIVSKMIYEVEYYNLVRDCPKEPVQDQLTYFRCELSAIRRFFTRNAHHFQYYESGATEPDHLYFIRDAAAPTIPAPQPPDADPAFSTALDNLFAKFAALSMLEEFIISDLARLSAPAGERVILDEKEKPGLKWTGEMINLVELVYGLSLTGQVNHGNASRAQIAKLLESAFHVSIGPVHRHFIDISHRKRLSQTKYIDQMKTAIQRKVDESNGL